MISERYSHSSCYHDKAIYVFGGCTSSSTTFNDLWRFDLSTRQWIRPLAIGRFVCSNVYDSNVTTYSLLAV